MFFRDCGAVTMQIVFWLPSVDAFISPLKTFLSSLVGGAIADKARNQLFLFAYSRVLQTRHDGQVPFLFSPSTSFLCTELIFLY